MAQGLSNPQRYRGFILTTVGLAKLHQRIQELEVQTRLRQSPRTIAERVQLNDPGGIHPITVRKILDGQHGVDRRSLQLVFQVLQLQLEAGDFAHAGLCQRSIEEQKKDPSHTSEKTAIAPKFQIWSEITDDLKLYGRIDELTELRQMILVDHCPLIQILGMAGIGKTALARMLIKIVEPEFDVVIWKSLHHAPNLSTVLVSILQKLAPPEAQLKLPSHFEGLIELLIEQLQSRRCLLVLDHFDSILCSKQFAGYYRSGYELYNELLQLIAEVSHQSCLVITSREKPRTIGIAAENHSRSFYLRGLSASECWKIAECDYQLVGTLTDWRSLTEQYHGNPLILKTVTTYIQDYFNGSISDYLKNQHQHQGLFGDLHDLLKQQLDRLTPLEQDLVIRFALHREPISGAKLSEEFLSSTHQPTYLEGLDSLTRRSLLHRQEGSFKLDPLIKAYVDQYVIDQQSIPPPKRKLEVVPNNPTVA